LIDSAANKKLSFTLENNFPLKKYSLPGITEQEMKPCNILSGIRVWNKPINVSLENRDPKGG